MVRRVVSISGSPLADWAAFGDKFRAMNTSMVFGERVRIEDNTLFRLKNMIIYEKTTLKLEKRVWKWSFILLITQDNTYKKVFGKSDPKYAKNANPFFPNAVFL